MEKADSAFTLVAFQNVLGSDDVIVVFKKSIQLKIYFIQLTKKSQVYELKTIERLIEAPHTCVSSINKHIFCVATACGNGYDSTCKINIYDFKVIKKLEIIEESLTIICASYDKYCFTSSLGHLIYLQQNSLMTKVNLIRMKDRKQLGSISLPIVDITRVIASDKYVWMVRENGKIFSFLIVDEEGVEYLGRLDVIKSFK